MANGWQTTIKASTWQHELFKISYFYSSNNNFNLLCVKMNVAALPGTATLIEDLDSKFSKSNMQLKSNSFCWNFLKVITNLIQFKFHCIEKVIVVLRDGRTLIGILRSVDQFANLVLHRTIERIHVGKEYGDIPRGVFIVRGENVALLGEIVMMIIIISRPILLLLTF